MDARVDRDRTVADVKGPGRISVRRLVRWSVLALILIAIIVFGFRYWHHSRLYVSTDDGYVNANVVQIAAQVSGPVVRLDVRDQQHVERGQLLFEIDPRPFQIALDAATATLDQAQQSVEERTAAISAARALVAQREAELRNAQSNDRRTRNLIANGYLSAQSAEATHTEAQTAAAALSAARSQLQQAVSALGSTGSNNADVRAAEARIRQARLDLEHTRVTAPTRGTIANLTLRPGGSVAAQAPLFSIVSDEEYWIDANFKETQLSRVRAGERAKVVTDLYPDHPFTGEVESLSGGSGAAFSLLPPENATGNWVKVTQRVPVRVRILDPDPARPLRIGTTATVEVRSR
jgi:membrane fusion protein (multidrug efflux system)